MGYTRGPSNYLEIMALSNRTHMMIMIDLTGIDVETLRIDSGFSFEKEFT